MVEPPVGEFPIISKLPSSITKEVGRVVTRYALLEHILMRIIYLLIEIGPKEGRLAIREPRLTDRFSLIRDLFSLKGLQAYGGFEHLPEVFEAIGNQRDQIAHGVWLKDPRTKKIFLRITKGTWQPVKGAKGRLKRVIYPEGREYGVPECRSLVKLIDRTIVVMKEFHHQTAFELRSLKKKSP